MAEEEKKTAKKAPAKKKVKEEAAPETPVVEEAAPADPKAAKKAAKEAAKAEKAARKAAKEAAKAAPAKPVVTEAKASATNIHVTPRKVRLVCDVVRGKGVDEALAILANINKAGALPVAKLIKSAAANATNNFGMDEDNLYIASIQCSDGLRMKRYIPRAKGSASGIVKRLSNVYVVIKQRAE